MLRARLLLKSRLSARTFQRSVKRLEASGAIRRIKDRAKDGTRLATKYVLTPAAAPQITYPKRTFTHPPPLGATVAPSTKTSRCQIEQKPGATVAPIRRVTEEAPLQGASSSHRPSGVTPLEANASAAHTKGAEDGQSNREVSDTPLRRDVSPPDDDPPASPTLPEPGVLVYQLSLKQETAKLDKAACTQDTPPPTPSPVEGHTHRAMHEAVLQVGLWSNVFFSKIPRGGSHASGHARGGAAGRALV